MWSLEFFWLSLGSLPTPFFSIVHEKWDISKKYQLARKPWYWFDFPKKWSTTLVKLSFPSSSHRIGHGSKQCVCVWGVPFLHCFCSWFTVCFHLPSSIPSASIPSKLPLLQSCAKPKQQSFPQRCSQDRPPGAYRTDPQVLIGGQTPRQVH